MSPITQQEETIQRDLELGKIRIAKLKETMRERAYLPFKMERHFHREDYNDGSLTITFANAGHLADAWAFARKHNKTVAFEQAIMRLVNVALGAALPQRECTWPDGTKFGAHPGRDAKITIGPDGFNEPSFGWYEEKSMVGGLIWHHRDASWSIHT